MAVSLTAAAPTGTSGYTVMIADSPGQVAAARRLRHEVLAGASEPRPPDARDELDADEFDEHCDHLIVRDDATGAVVGTYRLLTPQGAARAGRRPGDGGFDLSALRPLRDQLVEVGGFCVHPAHRCGAVADLMWIGVARYLHLHNLRWVSGSVPLSLADGGQAVAAAWAQIRAKHLSPPALRVRPRRPWPVGDTASGGTLPPLLRGHLRLGTWVCGEPAHDPDRGTAAFYLLFSTDRMDRRYRRHLLGAIR